MFFCDSWRRGYSTGDLVGSLTEEPAKGALPSEMRVLLKAGWGISIARDTYQGGATLKVLAMSLSLLIVTNTVVCKDP